MEKAIVLVVEDEALIRISALDIVEDAGFAVLEACNADEAIAILESRNDIRAVLTDIRMPGSMDGWESGRGHTPPLAADAPDCGVGACSKRRRFARKRAVYRQALRGRADHRGAL